MKIKVSEVTRLAELGKTQLDYLLRKIESMQYCSPGVEYHLDTDYVADLFVQILYKNEAKGE